MTYIVMDLEWNGAYSKKAHGYFNEIIEIGAVKLDDSLEITGRFHAVIKPVVSKKLSEIITNLTSITDEELEEGTTFSRAVSQLRRWIGSGKTVLLTWSTTDLLVLMENCRFFYGEQTIPFMHSYLDLQAYAQRRMGADMSQQMGLSRACEALGISEEGSDLHRALDDSLLTAQILMKVFEPASFEAAVSPASQEFYDRITFKTTIISDIDSPLIQRSELRFACENCGRNLKRTSEWKFRNRAFFAEFHCAGCGKDYTGRIQFKQKYEGIDIKKRLAERVKPEAEEASGQADPPKEAKEEP